MSRRELRWAVAMAGVVMLITCLPYLYVASLAPPGTTFSGLLCAADDHCVYLSWEQQAAQGRFLMRNLFTGDPQRGVYISLLSWFLGTAARVTGLPLILVHHGARILFGMLTLVLAYRLFALFTSDIATRRAAFWFAAFSAGFGWLFQKPVITGQDVVDLWQPEAITFLCLYVNGLFCVALAMMLGIFVLLLTAEGQTGKARWSRVIGAGVLGLLLGNIHSYDVITVAVVWAVYLLVRGIAERRVPGRELADAVVAGLVALPGAGYQYYLYRTEPVFRLRADDQFLSPPLASFLLGYGLVLLLAIGGACWLILAARRDRQPLGPRFFPLVWAIAGFAIPYLPFAFQRKLLLGAHLPVAFLAGLAVAALVQRIGARPARPEKRRGRAAAMPAPAPWVRLARTAAAAGMLLLCMPSNWLFVRRDVALALASPVDINALPAFLPRADMEAIRWARQNLPEDGLIFCSTVSGRLIPALAGRPVYVGHWSETPRANERMMETIQFYRAVNATSAERRAFLRARGIRYVYQGTPERQIGPVELSTDPIFHPVFKNDGAAIYELRDTTVAGRTPPAASVSADHAKGEGEG